MEYLFVFVAFSPSSSSGVSPFCSVFQPMSAADLSALSDDQLRARYQNVIGSPAPRGPAVTRDLLVRAILAKKGSPAASTSRTPAAPAHTATPPAAKKPVPAASKQAARIHCCAAGGDRRRRRGAASPETSSEGGCDVCTEATGLGGCTACHRGSRDKVGDCLLCLPFLLFCDLLLIIISHGAEQLETETIRLMQRLSRDPAVTGK